MDLLTYSEAARLLGVPTGSLYSMVSRKQIPHLRIARRTVRFERASLEKWLAKCSVVEHSAGDASTDGGKQ